MASHKSVQTSQKVSFYIPQVFGQKSGDTRLESGDQNVQKGHPLKISYN